MRDQIISHLRIPVSNKMIYSDSLTSTYSHPPPSEAIRFVIHCPPGQGS